ncbi:MYND-type domain-containing protein [Favolaschia claudopus]|uniref:MYND-type domain-containing protein n=1 Tax=Favolaschia claudopus TaxID=2862362 RepID=A0AAV9ZT01_9AGAR
MVSYSILSIISRHMDNDKLFSLRKPLPNASWYEKWMLFYNVAKRNMAVFKAYKNGQYTSIRGCHNMKCRELRRPKDIKRCGSCHQMNYCSTECQSVDWKEGHRDICHRLRPLRLEYDHPTLRERSFITALAHHEHEASILDLCLKKISFMHTHPDEAYYILFDYTSTHSVPLIRSVQQPPRLRTSPSNAMLAQWEDQVNRAAHSEGRMELLVVVFGDGKSTYRRMVPLRSPTSIIQTGLRRIADSLQADVEHSKVDIRKEVENLLARRRELGEHALEWEGVQTE